MIRVNIVCEGETEEEFVKDILYHHLSPMGIFANPINLKRGDNYQKFRRNVDLALRSDTQAYVSSMIDLYGMNSKFPGYTESASMLPQKKVEHIEQAIWEDVAKINREAHRFIPYVQLHEFEALLFSDPAVMEDTMRMDHPIQKDSFSKIRKHFTSPEDINDSVNTAPSKRILSQAPGYEKNADGIIIALEIGIHKIRSECPHFSDWLQKLEALGS